MTRRRLRRSALAAASLLVLAIGTDDALASGGAEAAHLFAYYPKEGMQERFDDVYRRHLDWHRRQADPLVWYGWYVTHGDRAGLFVDGSFGRPFAAFDERVEPAADAADFARTTAPYADPVFRRTYVLRHDLGTGQPLEEERPSASIQVFHYRLRPGTERRFERVALAAREALQRLEDAPEYTWYELVVGGEQPGYMLMVARQAWSDYDRFRTRLSDLATRGRDPDAAQRLLADLTASVESAASETWHYRPDLSYFPDREPESHGGAP